MLFYEINLLISPNFTEDEISTFIGKMEADLQKYGKIVSDKKAERKKLAYSVENQIEAWFYFLQLRPEVQNKKEMLDSVEKLLKEEKEVIRFLIIKKDTKKTEAPAKPQRTRPHREEKVEEAEITEKAETTEEKSKKQKVQLEEIDEKLNEMLGE
ncbi:30S ribosomal protein S6 [bacterium]|jgi:ribosomal protein S6|nr:30S ribosomal protein S6 [bacterium]